MPTANKSSEKKISELEGSQGKVEAELQEKIRNLEREVENANTRLADFKRRGAVFYHSDTGLKLRQANNTSLSECCVKLCNAWEKTKKVKTCLV